jgi:hypothetical protein
MKFFDSTKYPELLFMLVRSFKESFLATDIGRFSTDQTSQSLSTVRHVTPLRKEILWFQRKLYQYRPEGFTSAVTEY